MGTITTDFLKLVLPEELFEYFELTSHVKEKASKERRLASLLAGNQYSPIGVCF